MSDVPNAQQLWQDRQNNLEARYAAQQAAGGPPPELGPSIAAAHPGGFMGADPAAVAFLSSQGLLGDIPAPGTSMVHTEPIMPSAGPPVAVPRRLQAERTMAELAAPLPESFRPVANVRAQLAIAALQAMGPWVEEAVKSSVKDWPLRLVERVEFIAYELAGRLERPTPGLAPAVASRESVL